MITTCIIATMKTIRTPCRDRDYIGETITEESVAFMRHDVVDEIPSPVPPLEEDSRTGGEVEVSLAPTSPSLAVVVEVVKASSALRGETAIVYTVAPQLTFDYTTDGTTDGGSTHHNGRSVTYSQITAPLDNTTNGNRFASICINDTLGLDPYRPIDDDLNDLDDPLDLDLGTYRSIGCIKEFGDNDDDNGNNDDDCSHDNDDGYEDGSSCGSDLEVLSLTADSLISDMSDTTGDIAVELVRALATSPCTWKGYECDPDPRTIDPHAERMLSSWHPAPPEFLPADLVLRRARAAERTRRIGALESSSLAAPSSSGWIGASCSSPVICVEDAIMASTWNPDAPLILTGEDPVKDEEEKEGEKERPYKRGKVLVTWQSRSSETMVQRDKTSSVSILFEMVDPCYEIIDMELSSYMLR